MTTDSAEQTLTIDELAAQAGVTVRTVRFYSTKGLLPPPVIGARRVGRYGDGHLARLELIEELQQQGMTLAAIERYVRQLPPGLSARELAIHRAVVASWAPDTTETTDRRELERHAGRPLTDDDVRRLAAMGVVRPDGDAFRFDTGPLRLGVRLLDVPLSQESILAARNVLVEHARGAAHELAELFRGEVSERETRAVRSLSAHMHPIVVQALLTAFQRSLKEELDGWMDGSVPADGSEAPGAPGASGASGASEVGGAS
ncbi:MerR family transcriptional regulator [Streptomyces sp. NPDC090106]|uniref:MerR family transcriptional regulator n=1 Tax=Streptomyces sp. NPDC090106 TaxID=3365946 RepID=UPI0037FC5115